LEHPEECRTYFAYKSKFLIKSNPFKLLDRKKSLKSDMDYEVILVDAEDFSIQHPNKDIIF
jgi:hypothetical protein